MTLPENWFRNARSRTFHCLRPDGKFVCGVRLRTNTAAPCPGWRICGACLSHGFDLAPLPPRPVPARKPPQSLPMGRSSVVKGGEQ